MATTGIEIVKLKRDKLEAYYRQYEEVNFDIMDDEDILGIQDKYFEIMARLQTHINQQEATEVTLKIQEHETEIKQTTVLPEVKIPVFSGQYSEYYTFFELFKALIDGNQSLADIQKLFYLRNFTKGEPHELIKNLPVTGNSYKEALKLIKDRYDNTFLMISETIHTLLDLPEMRKFAAEPLRQFISNAKQVIASLKNLKQPVEQWDMMLLVLLCRKLDVTTLKMFHLEEKANKGSVEKLFSFLESRATAQEETFREKSIKHDGASTSKHAFTAQVRGCILCGKSNHKLYKCFKFNSMNIDERLQLTNDKKLCPNCLNKHADKCKLNLKCKKCHENHNTLLHKENEVKSFL